MGFFSKIINSIETRVYEKKIDEKYSELKEILDRAVSALKTPAVREAVLTYAKKNGDTIEKAFELINSLDYKEIKAVFNVLDTEFRKKNTPTTEGYEDL